MFPIDVDVWEVTLPRPRGAIHQPFRRMGPLLDASIGALIPWLAGPYVLFGHSLGALAAFEVARTLAGMGHSRPHLVVVSGCPAPSSAAAATAKTLELSDAAFCDHLRERYGVSEALLGSAELMRLALPFIRAEFEIYETYEYTRGEPLTCRIVGLCGDRDAVVQPEEMRGWAAETRSDYAEHIIPGDHFFPIASYRQVTSVIRRHIAHLGLMHGDRHDPQEAAQ